jgi:hypothetical protein
MDSSLIARWPWQLLLDSQFPRPHSPCAPAPVARAPPDAARSRAPPAPFTVRTQCSSVTAMLPHGIVQCSRLEVTTPARGERRIARSPLPLPSHNYAALSPSPELRGKSRTCTMDHRVCDNYAAGINIQIHIPYNIVQHCNCFRVRFRTLR